MVKQIKELIQIFKVCTSITETIFENQKGALWAIFVIQQNYWITVRIIARVRQMQVCYWSTTCYDFSHDKVQVTISEISFFYLYILILVLPAQICNSSI